MTTIYMKITSESMSIEFSELHNKSSVWATSVKSCTHSQHSIELKENEIRQLRNFLSIQLRKLKEFQS